MHPESVVLAGSHETSETSRRTLVRGAAWVVPALSVAAAAPAYAAVSNHGPLLIQSARFRVEPYSARWFSVIPELWITNPRSIPADQVVVTLEFPVSDFTGTLTNTDPPAPDTTNLSVLYDQGWQPSWEDPEPGDTAVYFDLGRSGLAAGKSCVLGTLTGLSRPGFLFSNDPTAQHIPFTVYATFAGVASTAVGVLTRIDPPAS